MRPSLTAAARDGRTIVRVGTEEWLRRGPNQRMARHRRATCRQIRSPNPKLSPLHGTGASPTAEPLDSYYISCNEVCFRRTVLTPAAVKEFFFEFKIPEEASSWTTRISVAAAFKGGPPELPR